MSDFGMAPTDDGLTPKIGHTSNLDAKTFILGQGTVMGKGRIRPQLTTCLELRQNALCV